MYRLPWTASRLGGGSISLGLAGGAGVTTGMFDAAAGFAALAITGAGVAEDGGADFFSDIGLGEAVGVVVVAAAVAGVVAAGFGASFMAMLAGFETSDAAGGGAADFTGVGAGVTGAGSL